MAINKEGIYREGREYQGGVKRQWLIQNSFRWYRGQIISNGDIWSIEEGQEYLLKSEDTWEAFRQLAECISSPGLKAINLARIDITHTNFPQWIRLLSTPITSSTQNDIGKLQTWVEKYGLPLPANSNKMPVSEMLLEDILVIAHLANTAYVLFESSKTKEGREKLQSLAHIYPLKNDHSRIVFCSLPYQFNKSVELIYPNYPSEMCLLIPSKDPDQLSNEIWRRLAWLWITQICEQFIHVEVQIKWTKEYRLRPILSPTSLLSWLWFQFLSYIGESSKGPFEGKTCNLCGQIYFEVTNSPYCKQCRHTHKNALKDKSRKDKNKVLSLFREGKSIEEIVSITHIELKRVKNWQEVFSSEGGKNNG